MNEYLGLPAYRAGPSLTRDEALLLDWLLTYPMPAAVVELDWHLKWEALRLDLWSQLATEAKFIKAEMSEREAAMFLAITPTTFRWGNGSDCGYSLKIKLARFIQGKEEEPDADNQDTSTDKAPAQGYTAD